MEADAEQGDGELRVQAELDSPPAAAESGARAHHKDTFERWKRRPVDTKGGAELLLRRAVERALEPRVCLWHPASLAQEVPPLAHLVQSLPRTPAAQVEEDFAELSSPWNQVPLVDSPDVHRSKQEGKNKEAFKQCRKDLLAGTKSHGHVRKKPTFDADCRPTVERTPRCSLICVDVRWSEVLG